jgi:hypothetical protein
MRRVVVIAVAGLVLAGCSSFSLDSFKSAPPTVTVQLESVPPGADARTSGGQGCKTPCSVSVPAADFTVTYTLNKFQTLTVPVQVVTTPGDITSPATTSVDPNPVVAELQPAVPLRKHPAKMMRPKKPKKPKAAPAGAAPETSPFPPPTAAPAR